MPFLEKPDDLRLAEIFRPVACVAVVPAVADARAFYCGLLGLRGVEKLAVLQERGGFWLQVGDRQVHVGTEERDISRHGTPKATFAATSPSVIKGPVNRAVASPGPSPYVQ